MLIKKEIGKPGFAEVEQDTMLDIEDYLQRLIGECKNAFGGRLLFGWCRNAFVRIDFLRKQ